jgi:hypothetical protein
MSINEPSDLLRPLVANLVREQGITRAARTLRVAPKTLDRLFSPWRKVRPSTRARLWRWLFEYRRTEAA